MPRSALCVLPPLPEDPPEVAASRPDDDHGGAARLTSYSWQKGRKPTEYFDFFEIVVVVRLVVTKVRTEGSVQPGPASNQNPNPTPAATLDQLRLDQWVPSPLPRPVIQIYGKGHSSNGKHWAPIRLTEFERAQTERDVGELEAAGVYETRPRTYGECPPVGPCPWVSCRHNLYLTDDGGTLRLNFPGKDIDELEETCALRAADQGPQNQEEVGRLLGLSWMRVSQIENQGLVTLRRRMKPCQG